jgi:hypothetical protein
MPTMTEAIRLVISGDSKGAVKALNDVSNKTKETSGVFSKYGAGLNKAANYGTVALVGLVGVIGKSVSVYNQTGKAIRDVTRLTDISTESASMLVGQWKRFGVDATAGANGVKFLMKNLDAARQGAKPMVEAFQRLGFSMEDLKTMDDDEILFKTRDALAKMGPGADRTAIAMKLLGRGGAALMPWLNVMPKEMDKVNQSLKDNSQIWSSKDLKQYADFVKAQREMQVALTGIYIVIARDVVPSLTKMVQGVGWIMQKLRPFHALLVPLTVALAAFVVAIKTLMFAQKAAVAMKALYTAINVGKMGTALGQMRNMNKLLPTLTKGLAGSAAQMGLVGVAAAGAAVAIMQAYDAAKQLQDAMAQLKTATDGANAALDKNEAKLRAGGKGQFVDQQRAQIERDSKVKTPWYYYLNPAYAFIEGASKLKFASGGDFITRGTTPFIAGEDGAERVTITPLGKSGVSRGGSQVHIHIGTVMGTDRMAAEKLATMVSEVLTRRVRYANA